MVENKQRIQSGGRREKFPKSDSLVNANVDVILLHHFAKYHVTVVQ
jgi:hypothetical protein